MVDRVDAATRQHSLAEAVVRLLARSGFEAVTVRAVAAEAGVSTGAVQKQFATKDALLLAGVRLVVLSYAERNDGALDLSDLRSAVRTLLLDAMPLDPDRRTEALVWSALTDRAGRSPVVAELVRAVDADALTGLTELLEAAGIADPGRAATLLIAVCDGLAVRLTYDPTAAEAALRAFDDALDAVWP